MANNTLTVGSEVQIRNGNQIWYGTVTRIDPNFAQGVPGRAINVYVEPDSSHPDGETRCFEAMCYMGRDGFWMRHNGKNWAPETCLELC